MFTLCDSLFQLCLGSVAYNNQRRRKGRIMQTEYQSIFERSEQKYLLQEAQYTALEQAMWPHMQPDSYGMTTIYSLYFDTPDYRLIRTSLEKPVYKEKLRLRCYGRPDSESTAFIELKKKYDGVVYKRRIEMPYEAAMQYLCGHLKLREMPQILQEVEWVRHFYGMLQPAMVLTYDRVAWFGRGRYIRPGAFSFSGGHGAGNRQYFPGYGSWSGHRNGIFGDGGTLHFGNLCGADVADLLPVWQNQANGTGIERGHSGKFGLYGII